MQRSTFLAKVIGWYCVILSLVMIFRQEQIKAIFQQIASEQALLFIVGIMTLILGLLLVISHNVWKMRWPLLITLLSWLTLISGIVRLIYPEIGIEAALWWFENTSWLIFAATIYLLIGIYLLYKAYSHLFYEL
ncbi:hypothetical protein [Legionella londiniensis]|uniref:Integral membrane protein (PIN domain superfamily) n=1 Tax=Legionella londiniensis TaxID=45068 RepID=A0A0W0VNV3_9GAMM|nr:hypothetical protein [Legionella londiniensis]KTD21774.1 Integral membrane protein (PIN domain superfamily) [Legionella londiniensis]STX92150.1 Integral membrane protein (PIN domain superfamily) [Legionella londiniensis]